jgi:hypothetical protein
MKKAVKQFEITNESYMIDENAAEEENLAMESNDEDYDPQCILSLSFYFQ